MVSLITYADRLVPNIAALTALLEGELSGVFDGVHILPFFDPIDGADAGFDPSDHLSVDQRIGSWGDISRLARTHRVMADLIVNHVSVRSRQFQEVAARGSASEFWPLFLRKDQVFGGLDDADMAAQISRIYRPRPGQPFSALSLADGSSHDFWTTFSPEQIDIDVESDAGKAYLVSILDVFHAAGIRELRLDAAGYAVKRAGSSCFMLPETFEFIASLTAAAAQRGMETLVEVHSHFEIQQEIARSVGRVYDFALPPLVLHALYENDASPLKSWLAVSPRNCVTVLDTHDGIGIVDVGSHGDRPGLLDEGQIDRLVNTIHERTGGASRQASGYAASNLDIYQVNSTYYDALGRDDAAYLLARAIQFFVPGAPQVYYVGLLAGHNDLNLVSRTGVGRDINRHYYSQEELQAALRRPVVQELLALIRLRGEMHALDGEFSMGETPATQLELCWRCGVDTAVLSVDLPSRRAVLRGVQGGEPFAYTVGELCAPQVDVA